MFLVNINRSSRCASSEDRTVEIFSPQLVRFLMNDKGEKDFFVGSFHIRWVDIQQLNKVFSEMDTENIYSRKECVSEITRVLTGFDREMHDSLISTLGCVWKLGNIDEVMRIAEQVLQCSSSFLIDPSNAAE